MAKFDDQDVQSDFEPVSNELNGHDFNISVDYYELVSNRFD